MVPGFQGGAGPWGGSSWLGDGLPGGLVSFDFLLTGFLESPLSLFLDSQDTSVSVPGEKEHKILEMETRSATGFHLVPPSTSRKGPTREGVAPSADSAWALIVLTYFAVAKGALESVLGLICPSLKVFPLSWMPQGSTPKQPSLMNGISFLSMILKQRRNLDDELF